MKAESARYAKAIESENIRLYLRNYLFLNIFKQNVLDPTPMAHHCAWAHAKEYHVERYFREAMISRLAPVSPQLVLCLIAEKVLGLPKSY